MYSLVLLGGFGSDVEPGLGALTVDVVGGPAHLELQGLLHLLVVLLAEIGGGVAPADVMVGEVLEDQVAHVGHGDPDQHEEAEQHVDHESGAVDVGKVEGEQVVDEVTGHAGKGGVEGPGHQTHQGEDDEHAQVEEVFGGGVLAQAFVVQTTADQADAAADDAEHAQQADGVDDVVHEGQEAAVGVHAEQAQEGGHDQDDGAAHQHVQTQVEGVGAEPQLEVMGEGGVQEEHFFQQGLDVAHVVDVAGLGPPVGLFHEAAAVGAFGAFMRHGSWPLATRRGASL